MLKRWILGGLVISISIILFLLLQDEELDQPVKAPFENVLEGESLRVGICPDSPPFAFRDYWGKVRGFEKDLAEAISEELGVDINFRYYEFADIIPALKAGHLDIAIAGVTATPKRRWHVDFTTAYLRPRLVYLIPARLGVMRPGDLAGKRLGVQAGTIMHAYGIELYYKRKDFDLIPERRTDKLIEMLRSNKLDLLVLEEPVAQQFALRYKDVSCKPINYKNLGRGYSIAVAKGHPRTVELLNQALAQLRTSGRMNDLEAKWLGHSKRELQNAPRRSR